MIFSGIQALSFESLILSPLSLRGEDNRQNKLTHISKAAQEKGLESLVVLEVAGFSEAPFDVVVCIEHNPGLFLCAFRVLCVHACVYKSVRV